VTARVEITQEGRGGGIRYLEDGHTISFDWEFAMSPALALVWGPSTAQWDTRYPWAAGRQQEIYEFVGSEIVRQKASDGAYEYDLERGELTILNETGARRLGIPQARAAKAAEEQRLYASATARLEKAERAADSAKLEELLAREIRKPPRPNELDHALRLAAERPTETIKQALLWASSLADDAAPKCAALLLTMTGAATEPFDAEVTAMLGNLGLHVNYYNRSAAFEALSKRVGMELDTSQAH
jgi:hypothetical protein